MPEAFSKISRRLSPTVSALIDQDETHLKCNSLDRVKIDFLAREEQSVRRLHFQGTVSTVSLRPYSSQENLYSEHRLLLICLFEICLMKLAMPEDASLRMDRPFDVTVPVRDSNERKAFTVPYESLLEPRGHRYVELYCRKNYSVLLFAENAVERHALREEISSFLCLIEKEEIVFITVSRVISEEEYCAV